MKQLIDVSAAILFAAVAVFAGTTQPPSPTPEPGTIVMLGSALLAGGGYLGWKRWRSK